VAGIRRPGAEGPPAAAPAGWIRCSAVPSPAPSSGSVANRVGPPEGASMERTPVLGASGSVSLIAKVPGGLRTPESRPPAPARCPVFRTTGSGRRGVTSPPIGNPSEYVFPDPLGGRYLSATRFGGTRTTGLRGFGPTLFIHRCGNPYGWRGEDSLPPGRTRPLAAGGGWIPATLAG
jgi:hypothetical protein